MASPAKIVDEVTEKQSDYESNMVRFLSDYNLFADAWRQGTVTEDRTSGLSKSRVSETTRQTETLATMMYRMMTSADPNFEPYPLRPDIPEAAVEGTLSIMRQQQEWIKFRPKLLKACRSLALFGNVVIESPWTQFPLGSPNPIWEATDFLPRSMMQVFFDRNCVDSIENADFIGTMDFITRSQVHAMLRDDTGLNDTKAIKAALEDHTKWTTATINNQLQIRLSRAGYVVNNMAPFEFTLYRGTLDCIGDGVDYFVGILDRKHLVRFHTNPFAHRGRGVRIVPLTQFEVEPLGFGVGQFGFRIQRDLDNNRRRTSDAISFDLYGLWKMSRYGGVNPNDLQIKPWKIIPMDDMNSLEHVSLNATNAIQAGIKLEDMLKEDFRALTGATSNLQAEVTDSTATEASIAQSEAVRRISVMTEAVAENLYRPWLYECHSNNLQFLDRPIWARVSGMDVPVRMDPEMIPYDLGFQMRITTDKDFRPNRQDKLLAATQFLSSVRSQLPANVNILPMVEELMRGFAIDPRRVIMDQPLPMWARTGAAGAPAASGQGPSGPMSPNESMPGMPGDAGTAMPIEAIPGATMANTPVGPTPMVA